MGRIVFICVVLVCVLSATTCRKVRRVKRGWLSAAPAPSRGDVTCAFNPCSVPNFCGEGRTCKMDEKCMHHCECEQGSTHEQCSRESTKTTTPPTIKCTFDPCSSAAFACSGKRKCELGDFCIPQCVCTDESDHPLCVEQKEHIDSKLITTTSFSVDKKCDSCMHGDCVLDACVCHEGWQGDTCNKSTCTKQCSEGSDCHILPTSVQICIFNHSKHATSVAPSTTPVQHVTRDDVCNPTYVTRPVKARACSSGTTCLFGKCVLSDEDGEETCECDAGASGDTCEVTCCLDCGENMTCTRDNEEMEERCQCVYNLTGDNCTEPYPDGE